MRIILIVVCFHLWGWCFSQQKKDSVVFTDTIPVFTLRDLNEFDAELQKIFTINEAAKYQFLFNWLNQRFAIRKKEWEEKQKKQPKN
jgi:hypothetical protein